MTVEDDLLNAITSANNCRCTLQHLVPEKHREKFAEIMADTDKELKQKLAAYRLTYGR